MRLYRFGSALLFGIALAGVGACSGSDSSSSTSPTQTIMTDVLTGTVPAPINGILQSASNNFIVGQGGGTVSVTLTSANETLPSGGILAGVTMLIAVGNPAVSGCTPLTNASTPASPSSSPQLSGSLSAGTYCILVSDDTNQFGPVAYAVTVQHP